MTNLYASAFNLIFYSIKKKKKSSRDRNNCKRERGEKKKRLLEGGIRMEMMVKETQKKKDKNWGSGQIKLAIHVVVSCRVRIDTIMIRHDNTSIRTQNN